MFVQYFNLHEGWIEGLESETWITFNEYPSSMLFVNECKMLIPNKPGDWSCE